MLARSLLALGNLAQAEKEIGDAEVVSATEGRLRGIDTAITDACGHAANGKGPKFKFSPRAGRSHSSPVAAALSSKRGSG